MRGGRTAWYAPLGILFFTFLFAACKLNLNGSVPFLEMYFDGDIYHPSSPMTLKYRFFADEPVLRCRYKLTRNSEFLLAGETEPQATGVLYDLNLVVPELNEPESGEGRYRLQLVVQAERSREFVDLAFLDQYKDFFKDITDPSIPWSDPPGNQRFDHRLFVQFGHSEWSEPEPLGSPVTVYYTTDGTVPNPNEPSELYKGSPFSLPFDSSSLKSRPNYNYVCLGGSIPKATKRSRCLFETSVRTVFFSPR